ncbi:MAG: NAD(P)H-dependent oxidoreductase [Acidobacteria bacterium]|nr:NAD(P)H-dependent oxidoreductase [Acidobacteriota bacterium]
MKVFVVYWHPEPRSFNAAMFQAACGTLTAAGHKRSELPTFMRCALIQFQAGRTLTVKDPNYLKPDRGNERHRNERVSDEIESEIRKIEWCEMMIWQFPLWWFGLPAVLKGWVDRVFAMGRTYGGGRIYQSGVFRGKRALLSLTTGGPEDAYRKGAFNGDINGILRPIAISGDASCDLLCNHAGKRRE